MHQNFCLLGVLCLQSFSHLMATFLTDGSLTGVHTQDRHAGTLSRINRGNHEDDQGAAMGEALRAGPQQREEKVRNHG